SAPAQGRWAVGRARPVRRRWACRRWSRSGRSRAPGLRMRRTSCVHPRAFVSPWRRKRTSSRTGSFPRVPARREDELERLLRGVPFFRDLTALDAARLVGALEEVRYPAGAVVAEEGAAGDALYLLAEGEVEISVRGPDGELSLRPVTAPAHFGELGLLTSVRPAASR